MNERLLRNYTLIFYNIIYIQPEQTSVAADKKVV